VAARRSHFPLVPRYRVAGLPFGGSASLRRGHGSDIAGSRPYVRGDPVSTIDWRATARLSTAHGRTEFVVRERYAEEAPRVVVFCDFSASMALYPPPFPWLSKPAAVRSATELIIESAEAGGAAVAYLDVADGEPYWLPPGNRGTRERVELRYAEIRDYDAPASGLTQGLAFLGRFQSQLSSGTFVFVVSDFLEVELPTSAWLTAAARRWELVPVLVQDPTWERSFPEVGSIVLPLADPRDGRELDVHVSRREARARRASNERRRTELIAWLNSLALDPVLIESSDDREIDAAFLAWAARRRDTRSRR
jgi:uncharacterized protein (DUF58 family)